MFCFKLFIVLNNLAQYRDSLKTTLLYLVLQGFLTIKDRKYSTNLISTKYIVFILRNFNKDSCTQNILYRALYLT